MTKSQGTSKAGEMDWEKEFYYGMTRFSPTGWILKDGGIDRNELELFIRTAIQQAIAQERERIVKSLRMEHKTEYLEGLPNDGDRDSLRMIGWNDAVDEFNKKLDELLK